MTIQRNMGDEPYRDATAAAIQRAASRACIEFSDAALASGIIAEHHASMFFSRVAEMLIAAVARIDERPPTSAREAIVSAARGVHERMLLRHTDECLAYAAQTKQAFCIGPCGRLRDGEISRAQYLEEIRQALGPAKTEDV